MALYLSIWLLYACLPYASVLIVLLESMMQCVFLSCCVFFIAHHRILKKWASSGGCLFILLYLLGFIATWYEIWLAHVFGFFVDRSREGKGPLSSCRQGCRFKWQMYVCWIFRNHCGWKWLLFYQYFIGKLGNGAGNLFFIIIYYFYFTLKKMLFSKEHEVSHCIAVQAVLFHKGSQPWKVSFETSWSEWKWSPAEGWSHYWHPIVLIVPGKLGTLLYILQKGSSSSLDFKPPENNNKDSTVVHFTYLLTTGVAGV